MKEVKEGKSHLLDQVPFEIEVLVARGKKERGDGGREGGHVPSVSVWYLKESRGGKKREIRLSIVEVEVYSTC